MIQSLVSIGTPNMIQPKNKYQSKTTFVKVQKVSVLPSLILDVKTKTSGSLKITLLVHVSTQL